MNSRDNLRHLFSDSEVTKEVQKIIATRKARWPRNPEMVRLMTMTIINLGMYDVGTKERLRRRANAILRPIRKRMTKSKIRFYKSLNQLTLTERIK